MKQFWLGFTEKMANTFRKKQNSVENGDEEGADNLQNADVSQIDMAPESEVHPQPYAAEEPVNVEPDYEYLPPKKKFSVKKFIFWLFFLVVLAVAGGGFYYISTIDWNQHKGKIAAQFSQITGKKIVFGGSVDLKLLPSPYLTATNVKIYNEGAPIDEPLAEIKSLVANLSLMPLIHGDFDVKMMSLVEPSLFFKIEEDGNLNWSGKLSEAQKANLEEMKITLDSVILERAKFRFVDETRDIDLELENLNAEIMAQSIFGPYHVEGSYLKDNNPEGFAFSIGKLSSAFATTINFVINQPTTETYVRFDGSVMLSNEAVNGTVILDSKKFRDFFNSNFKDYVLQEAYDYPLAVSMEVNSNKTEVDIPKFVVKYGTTAGSGKLKIPFPADGSRPKAELRFDFTETNLAPVEFWIKSFIEKYKDFQTPFVPQYGFDVLADFAAVKGLYKDQFIKDVVLSVDFIDNKLNIRELKGVLPGDTEAEVKGDVYSDLERLTYAFDISLKSEEFRETLKWLGITPETPSDTVLKRINLKTTIAGNPRKIAVKPVDLSLDKSKFSGEVGIINDERPNFYVDLMSDMISFDNYFNPMPKEEAQKDFASRMNYRFAKLAPLNDFDMQFSLKLGLGIYENTPVENTLLKGSLKDGEMNVSSLSIGSAANAALTAQGVLRGFGESPVFENVKYTLTTKDVASMLDKLEIQPFDFDWKKLKNFESKGIATGNVGKAAIKAVSKLENIDFVYGGVVGYGEDGFAYNGNLELRAPDFVKMLNSFNVPYNPRALSLGMFSLNSKFVGTSSKFTADQFAANVGANTFEGSVSYDATQARKQIAADLKINKLELDKFFYNIDYITDNKQTVFRAPSGSGADFLPKPVFDKDRLNYEFYQGFDFSGKFSINRLSYYGYAFDFANFSAVLLNGEAKLEAFTSDFIGGKLFADIALKTMSPFEMTGNVYLQQAPVLPEFWGGRRYRLKSGTYTLGGNFNTSAESFETMFNSMRANVDLNITKPVVEGLNLQAIYDDLLARDTSEGLTAFVKEHLQKGETVFERLQLRLSSDFGNFHIEDGVMFGNNKEIKIQGDGNLSTWEMNTLFDVKYAQPDYLPGFSFTLSGSMENPVLDVDTEALAKMYNSRQAEIAAQNRSREEAELARLQGLMSDQMQQVKVLDGKVQNILKNNLQAKQNVAHNDEIRGRLARISQKVGQQEKEISDILLLGQDVNLSDDKIDAVKKRCEALEREINDTETEIMNTGMDNTKAIINDRYNDIVFVNNDAKKKLLIYQGLYADWDKRLAKIETFYTLTGDDKVKKLRKRIDDNASALDKVNNDVSIDFGAIQGSDDAGVLDGYASKIAIMQVDADRYAKAIEAGIQELKVYAEGKVLTEEDAYAQKLRDELMRKKVEENTGKIMIKDTGQSKTVVRDWEDIQKSEEAVGKEDVKLLDFSVKNENTVKKAGKATQDKKDEEAAGSVLILKTDGEVAKASGVIRKK